MKEDDLTVAFFGLKTYPPEIGGIETHVYNLSKELAKLNVNVIVFAGKGKNNSQIKNNHIDVYRVRHSKNRYLLKITMVLPILFILKKMRKKIDVFHAHDSVFGFFLSVLGYHPLVYTAHGCAFLRSDWPRPVRMILKFMELKTFKSADVIIAVDHKTKEVIENLSNRKVFLIPNGIRTEPYVNTKPPKEYPEDKIIIFSLGRMIPTKGFQDLIKAFLSLDENIKNKAELFIAGSGPMLNKLIDMAEGHKNIHVLGYVPKVEPYLAHSHIFVLPSHYEGFPFTLLEGMASKNACIATDVGDISKRFVKNEEIIIVKPGEVNELSKALAKLIMDEDLRNKLSNNAYKKVATDYSWEKITGEIYKKYLLLERRKK